MLKFLLAVALLCLGSEGQISCKNQNGATVDWYILYKKPNGVDFFYIDQNSNNGFVTGTRPINHQAGVLANTLNPIFNPTTACGYIIYNDQPPTGNARHGCGHSKGLVMADTTSVVWLVHSTPKFPVGRQSTTFFPTTGSRNAQTFICVTFPVAELSKIETHLRHIHANVFDKHLPISSQFSSIFQNFHNVWTPITQLNQLTQLYQVLTSTGSNRFASFFKKVSANAQDGDLYVSITEEVISDVYAQTWGRQWGRSQSYTSTMGHTVYNVPSVLFPTGAQWRCGSDHSKWCVSDTYDLVCIGDSNRSPSQYLRPGGALCLTNTVVKQAFLDLIPTGAGAASTQPRRTLNNGK